MACWVPDLSARYLCYSDGDQGEPQLLSILQLLTAVLQALQYVEPGRAALIKSSEMVTCYVLVTALSPLQAPHWLDLLGVVLVFLAVVAATIEDRLVDRKRWKWF